MLQLLGDSGRRRLLSSALGVPEGPAGPHDQALLDLPGQAETVLEFLTKPAHQNAK
jgi:hypothetical protein